MGLCLMPLQYYQTNTMKLMFANVKRMLQSLYAIFAFNIIVPAHIILKWLHTLL